MKMKPPVISRSSYVANPRGSRTGFILRPIGPFGWGSASRRKGGDVLGLAAFHLKHHRGFYRIAILVQGDGSAHSGEVLSLRHRLPERGPSEVRGLLHRVNRDVRGVVPQRAHRIRNDAVRGFVSVEELLSPRRRIIRRIVD